MTQFTQNWELPRADRLEINDTVAWGEAVKFSDYRLEVLEKIAKSLRHQEEEFIQKEREFVNDSSRFLETFDRHNQEFINQEEANVKRVQEEINKYRPETENFTTLLNDTRAESRRIEERIAEASAQLTALESQRATSVKGINPTDLSNLKFKDPQDPSNDIFKWIYESVYKGSRVDYSWKNFKGEAFKKNSDFTGRLQTLPIAGLRKVDFDLGKTVFDRKTENLAALEVKQKQNSSLRNLIDYIGNVVDAGALHTQIETDKVLLEEKNKELEARQFEADKLNKNIGFLQERIQHSNHYITTLRALKPFFNNVATANRERIDFQNDYQNSLQGNHDALDHLAERTSQRSPVDPNRQFVAQTSGTRVGEIEEPRHQEYEHVKEQGLASQGNDEAFTGEQGVVSQVSKKVEHKPNDLKDTDFANPKNTGCETCNIF